MPELNPYLFFNGNCAEAMRFYERTLGGKLEMMTHAESPVADQSPPGSADRIMHARLVFDGGVLMASDGMPSETYKGMHGFRSRSSIPRLPRRSGCSRRCGTPWMINGKMTTA